MLNRRAWSGSSSALVGRDLAGRDAGRRRDADPRRRCQARAGRAAHRQGGEAQRRAVVVQGEHHPAYHDHRGVGLGTFLEVLQREPDAPPFPRDDSRGFAERDVYLLDRSLDQSLSGTDDVPEEESTVHAREGELLSRLRRRGFGLGLGGGRDQSSWLRRVLVGNPDARRRGHEAEAEALVGDQIAPAQGDLTLLPGVGQRLLGLLVDEPQLVSLAARLGDVPSVAGIVEVEHDAMPNEFSGVHGFDHVDSSVLKWRVGAVEILFGPLFFEERGIFPYFGLFVKSFVSL